MSVSSNLSECPLLLRSAVRCVMIHFKDAMNRSFVEGDFAVVKRASAGDVYDFKVSLRMAGVRSRDFGDITILKLATSTQPPAVVGLYLYDASGVRRYGVNFVVSAFLVSFGEQLSMLFPSSSAMISVVDPVSAVVAELSISVEKDLRELSADDDLYSAVTRAVDGAFLRPRRLGALLVSIKAL